MTNLKRRNCQDVRGSLWINWATDFENTFSTELYVMCEWHRLLYDYIYTLYRTPNQLASVGSKGFF